MEPFIETYTGRQFWPLNPKPDDVHLEDIAHALAMKCRFAGHTREFYSVAQHSVLVSYHCHPAPPLYGLLHDAAEAYLPDVAAPIKDAVHFKPIASFNEVEDWVLDAVLEALLGPEHRQREKPDRWGGWARPNLAWSQVWPAIKAADRRALATEKRDLLGPLPWSIGYEPFDEVIVPLPPAEAKALFLARWWQLHPGRIGCAGCAGKGVVVHRGIRRPCGCTVEVDRT